MKNVIILGPGRTGSSLLSGLLSRRRFYINQEAIETRDGYPDGDYENPTLVELNKQLFLATGYGHSKIRFDKPMDIPALERLLGSVDRGEYRAFVEECDRRGPWLWKDPRLCYTMFFWREFLDLDNVRFILTTRAVDHVALSYTKNQVFFTKEDVARKYRWQIDLVKRFVEREGISALTVDHAELKDSGALIQKLNGFLGTDVTSEDFEAVHRAGVGVGRIPGWRKRLKYGFGVAKLGVQRALGCRAVGYEEQD